LPDNPVQPVLRTLGARPTDRLAVPDGADPGRISIVHGALAEVIRAAADGSEETAMVPATGLRPHPVAGDWVGIQGGAIVWISPRRSELRRPASSKQRIQVLAANLDLVLITVPIDRPINLVLLERLAVMAWDSGARPVVVLTKADEAEDRAAALAQVTAVLPDLRILITSSTDGKGIAELRQLLVSGVTAVMLGASGVGKTSLLNVLDDRDEFVRPVGPSGEGRHSTTTRKLHRLKSGGVLLDIPGIRLADAVVSQQGLDATFPEIEELTVHCQFRDCAHTGDQGCAVEAALRAGAISARRLQSWRQFRAASSSGPGASSPRPRRRSSRRPAAPDDDQ
jgi:ribosome biogenesis GTPase